MSEENEKIAVLIDSIIAAQNVSFVASCGKHLALSKNSIIKRINTWHLAGYDWSEFWIPVKRINTKLTSDDVNEIRDLINTDGENSCYLAMEELSNLPFCGGRSINDPLTREHIDYLKEHCQWEGEGLCFVVRQKEVRKSPALDDGSHFADVNGVSF